MFRRLTFFAALVLSCGIGPLLTAEEIVRGFRNSVHVKQDTRIDWVIAVKGSDNCEHMNESLISQPSP